MKTKLITLIILLIPLFYCCEKSDNTINIDSIADTKWTFSKITNNDTGETIEFPEQIDNFYIVFKYNGDLDLLGFCNFSYGNYEVTNTDSLKINNIGPSTFMYCLPDMYMDWELIFATNFPNSKTFSINQNQLTINCDSEYDLVFDFIENYSLKQGKVLFCTNSPIINCVFEIELSINDKIVDTLTSGSIYNNVDCQCENTLNVGLAVDLNTGEYNYYANELNCIATNKVNSWSGNFTVIEDSCTMIFLDITKE